MTNNYFFPPWMCNTEAGKFQSIIHILHCHAILFCYALHHYFNMTTIEMTQAQKMVKKPSGHVEWFSVAACR